MLADTRVGTTQRTQNTQSRRAMLTAALWALLRLWVGGEFLTAALSKIGDPAWTGARAGVAVRGFLGFAISPAMTTGPHPDVLLPYVWLTQHVLLAHTATLSYLVTAGEFLVGLALLLGLATRVAAVGGIFLNGVYLLSGSAGLNVPMFSIELAIALVGTTAGVIGLDSVVWPYLRRRLARDDRMRQGSVAAGPHPSQSAG